ncbi:hypothetical protein IEQ34_010905 [Dendrobium chrysotoxum]|uniref:Uncharacterized protein n=1 Tax=Dendrobium chrysotoxum TaxID=161865 RepID=A0AAV7GUT7_DENCH|nr:hypothetical protein IEQ34_010905 [Dendrobium chrysotoxum]
MKTLSLVAFEQNMWVICRVFEKSLPRKEKRAFRLANIGSLLSMFEEEMAQGVPLPPLMDAQVTRFLNSLYQGASSSFYCSNIINIIGDKFMASAVTGEQPSGDRNCPEYRPFEDLWNC